MKKNHFLFIFAVPEQIAQKNVIRSNYILQETLNNCDKRQLKANQTINSINDEKFEKLHQFRLKNFSDKSSTTIQRINHTVNILQQYQSKASTKPYNMCAQKWTYSKKSGNFFFQDLVLQDSLKPGKIWNILTLCVPKKST